jgi:hypothetical protein
MAHMMTYAWFDQDNSLQETKFGDHFVSADVSEAEAIEHTCKYIREKQFPRRGKHFDSGRVDVHVWNVSEAAKQHGKFYGASKMDDVIRPSIGRPGTQGKEFHAMPFDDLIVRVNEWIHKTSQPLPKVGLAQWQYDSAENVLTAMANGKRTIVAELCARFGKTIWGGALIKETGAAVTIIASYVQTVMSSFKKDLTSYEQFRDFVIVDTKDEDYAEQVAAGVADHKQVIALISMCSGGKRQGRIDDLFALPGNKLILIDEADFGAHKDGQTLPFKTGRGADDVVILMTGTNGDRAAGTWNVDHYLSVTYPELIMEKNA